ncbi:MAG: Ig-like domain-containing protein [Lachnospiraceae bacterium]|nr:Ig-like domain-containing protein [Candidatus Minthocola equi]
MKKFLAILLSVILTMAVAVPAFADGANISVSSASGDPGASVTLNVAISGNPGFANGKITINYDSNVLELTKITKGLFTGSANTSTGMINHASEENTTDNGNLCQLTFSIKSNAPAGDSTVSVTVNKLQNNSSEDLNPGTSSGKVTVNEVAPPPVEVTGVTLSSSSATLTIGETKTLTATVAPSDATNKNITWSSSNSNVATVDNGTVRAISTGSATITARSNNGKTATCAVTVNAIEVTGVTVTPTSAAIKVGATTNLSATVAPSNATTKTITWSSDNVSVATVSSSGVVTGVAAGTANITAKSNNGKTATCTVTVSNVDVTGVTVSPTTASVNVGSTTTLRATVSPSNATNKNVTWTSSDTSVATVNNSGVVTGVKAGTATITVTTTDGGKTATCAVTVSNVAATSVSLNKTSTTLTEGATEKLTATVSPTNATNKSVTWKSSNESVATVSTDGTITAKAAGTATITATTADGSNRTATCTVTVQRIVAATGVTLNKTTTVIYAGSTEKLTATVTPSDASNKNVTWKSSNESVATVSSDGTVTAVAAGTATITVTTADGGYTATCTVTVTNVAVTGVTLNKTALKLNVGSSETLTTTIAPSNASNKKVTWSSDKTSVATVSSDGKVTGVAAGEATITAKTADGGFTATCKVTVSTVAVTGVSIDKSSTTIYVGKTDKLKAVFTPSNATNKNVTWSSSDPAVATVSSDGTVTAVAEGTATITVKTSDGGKTATSTVTVKPETTGTYNITNVGDIDWKIGSSQGLTITSDADISKFEGVYVDTAKLDETCYTVVSGSTVVTLTPAYLETLAEGPHIIEIASTDGKASAMFTIAPSCTHTETYIAKEKKATCTEEGYTGDEFCKECNAKVADGEVIPATGHNFVNGVCAGCGAQDPDGGFERSFWENITQVAGWVALGVGVIVVALVVVLIVTKKKNKDLDDDEWDD